MSNDVRGKRVAILVAEGFEQIELSDPRKALEEAGARTSIVSLSKDPIRGFDHAEPAEVVEVDQTVEEADAGDFDALLLPGGTINPDTLRGSVKAIDFARSFFETSKPVFAICHGPHLLVNAEVVQGRSLTSSPTIRKDLENAGAKWVDRPVVVDKGLVTSRGPDDLPDFNAKMLEELGKGSHPGQTAGEPPFPTETFT